MFNISLIGFDVHKIIKNRDKKIKGLFIGGVLVDEMHRFLAHSDGDILIHALIDSISPFVTGKDIGQLFPDNDNMYKNYSSEKMLEKLVELIKGKYTVTAIDIILVIDLIKITLVKEKIVCNLKKYFPKANINIKGKKTEGAFKKNYGYCWIVSTIECV